MSLHSNSFLLLGLSSFLLIAAQAQKQQPAVGRHPSRSHDTVNEAAARASMGAINTACIAYSATYGNGFPAALINLGPSTAPDANRAGLIDRELSAGEKNDYFFAYVADKPVRGIVIHYRLEARPLQPTSGESYFWTDESGIIRTSSSELDLVISENQSAAVTSLRALSAACESYKRQYRIGYPLGLIILGPAEHPDRNAADLIDAELAAGQKKGYVFTYRAATMFAGTVPNFQLSADPITPGTTGQNHYFMDTSGVIRVNASAPAGFSDPPLSDRGSG